MNNTINIDKTLIIGQIISQLQAELTLALAAANSAHKAATDDQSVAETQYDTLAIEQSYLAEGQSRRVDEIRDTIKKLENLPFGLAVAKPKVMIGSLVQMQQDLAKQHWFLIAPVAGGYRCHLTQRDTVINITVITPQSPMGAALLHKELGDEVIVSVGNHKICDYVLAIQ